MTHSLHIGIDYVGSQYELNGCVNDAENLYDFLVGQGTVLPEHAEILREAKRTDIIAAIRRLAAVSRAQRLDSAFISFSGHGTYTHDTDGDEVDRYDECLCPADYSVNGIIRDDDISDLLGEFHRETHVTLLIDCCHSGSCADLPFRFHTRSQAFFESPQVTNQQQSCLEGDGVGCHPRVVMLSGCADDQTSADAYDPNRKEYTGAMTSAFLDCVRAEPTLLQDAFGLLTCMRILLKERAMQQIPQLSTSIRDPGGPFRAFLLAPGKPEPTL